MIYRKIDQGATLTLAELFRHMRLPCAEAAETQVWLEFAVKCGYLPREAATATYQTYEEILRMLVAMMNSPKSCTITPTH